MSKSKPTLSVTRSLYFSHLDERLPHTERTRIIAALGLLEHVDNDALLTLHRFHVKGETIDREAEERAAKKLQECLALVS